MQTKSIYHFGSGSCNNVNDHYSIYGYPLRNGPFCAKRHKLVINHHHPNHNCAAK